MAKTTLKFLIWTVEIEPCGFHAESKKETVEFRHEPRWYYISDDRTHSFGYAPGFMQAFWHYVRSIPAAIALSRWYRDGRRET